MTLKHGLARWALVLLMLGPGMILAPAARAQYFGQNKVQYRSFDFKVLKTEHFDIYYYDEEKEAAEQAGRIAERWYARLSRLLKHQLSDRQALILYASHPDFEQTNVVSGVLSESTGGVTESLKRRIVLPLAGTLGETDHVIGHELVHAFQYDMVGRGGTEGSMAISRLPLWFIEGMAEYLSIGAEDPLTAMWMRDAVRSDRLPSISKMADYQYFPYRYGHAFWAFVAGKWDDEAPGRALKAARRAPDVESALASVFEVSADSLSNLWHDSLKSWEAPVAQVTETPQQIGTVLIQEEKGVGKLNVAPALSPDGKRLMFLSERDLFSIELFLADAETGDVIKRITKTAVDPHFQSLQFIQSAGAWSADGRRFAFAVVVDGRPAISIIDVDSGREEKEIRLNDLGEVFNPTWSPDDRSIAFSAMSGGMTNLFIVDVESGAVRQLTNDLFSALHPAWSPDGRSIAYVTDRFTTRIDDYHLGDERLALIDPESGDITEVTAFDVGKHTNPQWSPDGSTLFFISNRDGIPNVYRVKVDGSTPKQITNLVTGVAGITPLSPALSVSRDADRIVFSVYEGGNYDLYRIDDDKILAGYNPEHKLDRDSVATLPPTTREDGKLAELLGDPKLGLVDTTDFERDRYRSKLSLDHVAQTGIGVAAGSAGFALGGGTTLFWSDILGDRNLATLLQINNGGGSFINNVAAVAAYENRKSRTNWVLAGAQLPYLVREFTLQRDVENGQVVDIERDRRFWQIDRQLIAGLAYPFSRVQRIELSAGYRNVSFEGEEEVRVYSTATGQLLRDETSALSQDTIPSLNLVTASGALVYDSSVFGGTSPVLGQRYRVELSPVTGDLTYVGVLTDYRRYQMLVRPLTLAGRVLHYGRYGDGGEDSRLTELFLGYGWLVRGYDYDSFSVSECGDPSGATCDPIEGLFGSRLAVANVELRLPLFGALGIVRSPQVPPVEAAAFFDAGAAWTRNENAKFLGGSRETVTSHGAAFRVNLFGFAVAEWALVHPNNRPNKGWYWQFTLQPGF